MPVCAQIAKVRNTARDIAVLPVRLGSKKNSEREGIELNNDYWA